MLQKEFSTVIPEGSNIGSTMRWKHKRATDKMNQAKHVYGSQCTRSISMRVEFIHAILFHTDHDRVIRAMKMHRTDRDRS